MSETRKLFVAFDPAKPNARSSDFVVPWIREGRQVLLGVKSGKESVLGVVVFIGRTITENDLFAKVVDLGVAIPDVDDALLLLRLYLDEIQLFKIGNVAQLRPIDQGQLPRGSLELVAKTPHALQLPPPPPSDF